MTSTRSRSRAPRCARASTRCRPRSLDERALEIRLLVDHRERLVAERTAPSEPAALASARARRGAGGSRCPRARWTAACWLDRIARRLAAHGADRAGQGRARRAAPHPRAHARRSTRSSASCAPPSQALRPRAARRARLGPLTAAKLIGAVAGAERFADRRPASPARPASRRSPSPRAAATATASTAAATASSTARCTASPSPAPALTPRPPPTSHRKQAEGKTRRRPTAASNATSPAASGTSCNHRHHRHRHAARRPPAGHRHRRSHDPLQHARCTSP